jgi:ATP/maltotriose-dependent transcriptional regulator MalT
MNQNLAGISKISRPRLPKIVQRKRLFRLLDRGRKASVAWVSGPGGSGKTTLIASWIDSRKIPCLWYRLDEGDSDLSTFFYYLGLAAKKVASRYKKPLPLLTPEYLLGISTFTRRYFEDLYARLKPPYVLVLDNYQDVPEASPFHDMVRHGLANVPQGVADDLSRESSPSGYQVEWCRMAVSLRPSIFVPYNCSMPCDSSTVKPSSSQSMRCKLFFAARSDKCGGGAPLLNTMTL